MVFSISVKKKPFSRMAWFLFFVSPLLTSCSSNQNNVLEIITPPKSPKEFSNIPEKTDNPKLLALASAEDKIKDIKFGRQNPFLSPALEGTQLLVPVSFEYHGQISSLDVTNAFVKYQGRGGTIKPGDIGGLSTALLPNNWTVLALDTDTKVLTLGFEDRSVDIDLFIDE